MILDATLAHLETSDLVRRLNETDPVTGSLAYSIKHALVQDTAQESLLKQERKRLNRLVAETLETQYAERVDEFAARLMRHYDAAGEDAKTIEYAERAGDYAARRYANAESISAYQRAFGLALAREANPETLTRLMTRLGRAYELNAQYDEAIALYRHARDRGHSRGEHVLELAALVQLAKVLAVGAMRYDPKEAQRISQDALKLARQVQDRRAEAAVLWAMMLLNLYGEGGARVGVQHGEESLALARELDWREQMAYSLNDLFYAYLNLGDAARSRQCAEEARALWRELDNKPMLADALNAASMDYVLRGEFEEANAFAFEARALAQSINNPWGECTSYMIEGYVEMERGHIAAGCAAFHECMRVGDPIMVHGPIVMARYELARIYAFLGDAARGETFARDALDRTRNHTLDWNSWAYAVLAEVMAQRGEWDGFEDARRELGDAAPAHYLDRMLPTGAALVIQMQVKGMIRHGEWERARERLEQLLARVRASGFQVFVPDLLNLLARVWLGQEEWEPARRALQEAQIVADALCVPRSQFEIALTRLELAQASGTQIELSAALAEARHASNALTKHMPPDLRESFLAAASARRIQ